MDLGPEWLERWGVAWEPGKTKRDGCGWFRGLVGMDFQPVGNRLQQRKIGVFVPTKKIGVNIVEPYITNKIF